MRQRLGVVAAVAMIAGLAGCGSVVGADGTSQAECTHQVRFHGTVYTEAGLSSESVTDIGMADEAACADIGEDPRGAYFPEDPSQVEVGTFDDYPASRVLGVHKGDYLQVHVSEAVDHETAMRIADDLR